MAGCGWKNGAACLTAFLGTAIGPVTAHAESAQKPKKGEESWDGQVSFTASAATGNTENTVLGAAFDARRIHGRYTHDIQSGVNYTKNAKTRSDGSKEQQRTQDRWFAQYRLESQTGDKTFLFARVRYEQDQFSGFENRLFVGGGVGHTWVEREDIKWSTLIGPGYQMAELDRSENPRRLKVTEPSGAALYAGSTLNWELRENVTFNHKFDTTWAEENTTVDTTFALKSKLTETLSSRLNYRVKYETDPPENREEMDTLLSASVVYGF